jgi:hypothetical protein
LDQSHCPRSALPGVPNSRLAAFSQFWVSVLASEVPRVVTQKPISTCRASTRTHCHCEQLLLSTHLTASVFKQDINHEAAGNRHVVLHCYHDRGLHGTTSACLMRAACQGLSCQPSQAHICSVDCCASRQLDCDVRKFQSKMVMMMRGKHAKEHTHAVCHRYTIPSKPALPSKNSRCSPLAGRRVVDLNFTFVVQHQSCTVQPHPPSQVQPRSGAVHVAVRCFPRSAGHSEGCTRLGRFHQCLRHPFARP